ncbi:MAG: LytR C-terminal domain-containing protein [Microbacterium sp.]
MPTTFPRDRFDDVPEKHGRVGAHRANTPGVSGGVVFLWAVVATILLTVIGIFAFRTASTQSALPDDSGDDIVATAQPTDVAVDTSYSVLVLNGTLASGIADDVADEIIALGFAEDQVIATESSVTDFETTTVYFSNDDDEAAAQALASAIGATKVAQSDAYATVDGEGKELAVVVGADRVSAG